jgi:hypothetical protein
MPYNERTPGADSGQAAHTYPISRAFAAVVVGALLLLFLLRHFFGSVRVEAGTR